MKLQDIILWIMFIIALIITGWYFFGNSPTLEQALLVLLLTLAYATITKISDIGVKLDIIEKRFNLVSKKSIS